MNCTFTLFATKDELHQYFRVDHEAVVHQHCDVKLCCTLMLHFNVAQQMPITEKEGRFIFWSKSNNVLADRRGLDLCIGILFKAMKNMESIVDEFWSKSCS